MGSQKKPAAAKIEDEKSETKANIENYENHRSEKGHTVKQKTRK